MVVWGDRGSENAAPIGPIGGIAKIDSKIDSKISSKIGGEIIGNIGGNIGGPRRFAPQPGARRAAAHRPGGSRA